MIKRLLLTALLVAGLSLPGEAPAQDTIGGRWILKNHYNEVVTDQHFRGQFLLIFFGYTFCPDVCPTALSNATEAMEALGPLADQVQPLFISVDPKRDTPTVLREYVSNFHPKIIGLTGSESLIKRTADLFKVKYMLSPESKPGDEYYLIDHSAGLYFMAPNGQFLVKFAHGISGADIAQRLKEIMASN